MSRRNRPPARPSQQALTAEDFRSLLSASEFERLLRALESSYIPSLRVNPLKTGTRPLKTEADSIKAGVNPQKTGVNPQKTGSRPEKTEAGPEKTGAGLINTGTESAVEKWRRKYGWQLEPVPYCDTGYWVKPAEQQAADSTPETSKKAISTITPSQSWEHKLGHFYLQDAASMLPPEVFDFPLQPDDLVLDMAASPGGKTTHLAARLYDRNLIVANDSSSSRLTALRLVLQTQGVTQSVISKLPGEEFGQRLPNTFTAVLLDAPCSMQGLRSSDSHMIRPISARELEGLALRQQRMLESAVEAAKPGGQIVYSTCTLNVGENEAVVEAVLKKFGSLLQVEDISTRLAPGAEGLTEWGAQVFDDRLAGTARLWPHVYGTAGFFCARLTKLKSSPLDGKSLQGAIATQSKLDETYFGTPLSARQTRELAHQWRDDFGTDLEPIMEGFQLILNTHQNQVWMLPQAVHRLPGLPVWARPAGFQVADITPDGFQPNHDFVARFFGWFSANRFIVVDEENVQAWLRGQSLDGAAEKKYPSRQVVVMADAEGLFLGLAKVVNGQFKNILPRRLVSH